MKLLEKECNCYWEALLVISKLRGRDVATAPIIANSALLDAGWLAPGLYDEPEEGGGKIVDDCQIVPFPTKR